VFSDSCTEWPCINLGCCQRLCSPTTVQSDRALTWAVVSVCVPRQLYRVAVTMKGHLPTVQHCVDAQYRATILWWPLACAKWKGGYEWWGKAQTIVQKMIYNGI
jgi:hypothetical protein